MTGNVFTGETRISSPASNVFIRVMHMSFGWPLISALHDPHLPALQFHRTARSGACVAWMRCTTSRTTIPSSVGTLKSTNAPPELSPRRPFMRTSVTSRRRACRGAGLESDLAGGLVLADDRAQRRGHSRQRFGRQQELVFAP